MFLARDRSKHSGVVLVIDIKVPSHADKSGLKELFSFVTTDFYKVKLLPADFKARQPDVGRWELDGVEILYGNWYKKNWEQWVSDNGNNISKLYFPDIRLAEKWLPRLKLILGKAMPEVVIGNLK